jgi:hypothetical protein
MSTRILTRWHSLTKDLDLTPPPTELAEAATLPRRMLIRHKHQNVVKSRGRWRRVWDSNPRIHHCITRFRIERLKPSSANPPGMRFGGRETSKATSPVKPLLGFPEIHLSFSQATQQWPLFTSRFSIASKNAPHIQDVGPLRHFG